MPDTGLAPHDRIVSKAARNGRLNACNGRFAATRRTVVLGLAATALAGAHPGHAAPRRALPDRGFNISAWLDSPGPKGTAPSDEVLLYLRAAGFRSVRLPVAPQPLAGDEATARKAADTLRDACKRLLAAGYSVTIDMHPIGAFSTALAKDADARRSVETAWRRASAVASEFGSDEVLLELLNEPQLPASQWRELRDRLAEIVRQRCPSHTLVWGASRYQTIEETLGFPPLQDARCVAAVHYYAPFDYTHQGKNWGKRVPCLPQGGSWSRERIEADFAAIAGWSTRTGTPVILNEFGVLDFCGAQTARYEWIGAVRRAAHRNGIGWTYWEFDRGFGFMKGRRTVEDIDAPVLAALLPDAVP